jgi:hypothetical protein
VSRGTGTLALEIYNGPVAQWLAQATHNRLVAGSNPAGPTFDAFSNARFILGGLFSKIAFPLYQEE